MQRHNSWNQHKCLGFQKWVDSTSRFGKHVCYRVGRVRAKTTTRVGHVGYVGDGVRGPALEGCGGSEWQEKRWEDGQGSGGGEG